ncbi:MAG TPA: hypothetical protein VHP58_02770 [Alphaproteobacteria bacterium]|nr:hypothetical protein [Alphaproteobacteria bacterium]
MTTPKQRRTAAQNGETAHSDSVNLPARKQAAQQQQQASQPPQGSARRGEVSDGSRRGG